MKIKNPMLVVTDIFYDLIPFIRKKKTERQIIVVTHNANVVVSGDAECVIVANQNGANSPQWTLAI